MNPKINWLHIILLFALPVYILGVAFQGDIPLMLERWGFICFLYVIAWSLAENHE